MQRCKFRDTKETEERIIEQLIVGTANEDVKRELLGKVGKDEKLTLYEAVKIASAMKLQYITCAKMCRVNKEDFESQNSHHFHSNTEDQRNPCKVLFKMKRNQVMVNTLTLYSPAWWWLPPLEIIIVLKKKVKKILFKKNLLLKKIVKKMITKENIAKEKEMYYYC